MVEKGLSHAHLSNLLHSNHNPTRDYQFLLQNTGCARQAMDSRTIQDQVLGFGSLPITIT